MKKFFNVLVPFLFLSPSLQAATENYCLAVRGNGEAMPAHWGAMSAVVQKKGMPSALAGGSSASISIFLMESLALNTRQLTHAENALLIKSFQGYFEAMTQTPEGKALTAILGDKAVFKALMERAKKLDQFKLTPQELLLVRRHLDSLNTLLNSSEFIGLINPAFQHYVKETISFADALASGKEGVSEGQVAYRKGQISTAIKNFGKFNAQTDETLFFRPGLINFVHLAKIFGQMGDFYAGIELKNKSVQKQINQDIDQFLQMCLPGSEKLTWSKLNLQRPACRQLFGRAVLTYREASLREGRKSVRINEAIGSRLASFPATSVLSGSAVNTYRNAREQYRLNADLSFGTAFRVSEKEVRFGYWGKEESLKKIERNLRSSSFTSNDEKSKKFLNLGSRSWLEALASSPAEPGLSSLVDLNQQHISAGGWSDLHPTLILKAHGCQDIVLVTRRGGESMFAQGVMKKLTNYDGFDWAEWNNLTDSQRKQKNSSGDSSDVGAYASSWSKLYNMANNESSIRKSLTAATTVVCTNWDNFDPRKEFHALVEDSFRAPWLTQSSQICR